MAKVKILADRISITSETLTDENIEKVKLLAPSKLKLFDEKDDSLLYEVSADDCATFSNYGATFKNSRTLGTIDESIMGIEDEDKRKNKIVNRVTAIVTRLNAIEEQVKEFLENATDLTEDIEFIED